MTPVGKSLRAVTWAVLFVPYLALECSRSHEVQEFCSSYTAQCNGAQTEQTQETGGQESLSWKSETPNIFLAGDDIIIMNANGVSENSLQELLSTIMAGGEHKSKLLTLTSLLEILISFFDNIDAEFAQGIHDDLGDDCDRFLSLWSNVRNEYQEKITVPHSVAKQPVSSKPIFPSTIFIEQHPSTAVSSKPSVSTVDYSIPRQLYSIPQKSKPEDFNKGTRRPNILRVEKQKPSVTSTSQIQVKPLKEAVHESSTKPISFVVERQHPPTMKYPQPSYKPTRKDPEEPQTFTFVKETHTIPTSSVQKFTFNFEKNKPASLISFPDDQKQQQFFSKTTVPKISVFKAPASKPVDHYYSKPKYELTLGSKSAPSVSISKPLTVTYDQYKPAAVKRPQNFIKPELNFSYRKPQNSQVHPVRTELSPEVVVQVLEIQEPTIDTVEHSREQLVRPTHSLPERDFTTPQVLLNKIELPARAPHHKFSHHPDTVRFSTPKRIDTVKSAKPTDPNTGTSNFFSKFTVPSRSQVQYQSTVSLPISDNKDVFQVLPYKPQGNAFLRPSVTVRDHKPTINTSPTHETSWIQALPHKVKNYSVAPYELFTPNRESQIIDITPIDGSGVPTHTGVSQQRPLADRESWKNIPSDAETFAGHYGFPKPQSPQTLTTNQLGSPFVSPTIDHNINNNQFEFPLITEGTIANTGDLRRPSGHKFNKAHGDLYSSAKYPVGVEKERPVDYLNYPELTYLIEGQKFDGNSETNIQDGTHGNLNIPSNNVPFSTGSSSIPNLEIDYLNDYKSQPQMISKEGFLNSFGSQVYDYRNPIVEEYSIYDGLTYENYENIGLSELGTSLVGYEDDSIPSYLVTDYVAEVEYGYYDENQNYDHDQEYHSYASQTYNYDQFYALPGPGEVEEFSSVNTAGILDPNTFALEQLYEYDLSSQDYLSYFSGYRGSSPARQSVDGSSLEVELPPVSYTDSLPQINIGTDFGGTREGPYYQGELLANPNLSTDFYTEFGDGTYYRNVERSMSQPRQSNQQPGIPQWDHVNSKLQEINFQNKPLVKYPDSDKSFYGYEELVYDDPSSANDFNRESEFTEEYYTADIFTSQQQGFSPNYKSQNVNSHSGGINVEYGLSENDQLIQDYLSNSNYAYDDLQASGSINSEGSISNLPSDGSLNDQYSWGRFSKFSNSDSFQSRADQESISNYQFSKDTSVNQASTVFGTYLDSYDVQPQVDAVLELEPFANSDYLEDPTDTRGSYGDQLGVVYGDLNNNYEQSYSSYDGYSSSLNPSYDLESMEDPERTKLFGKSLSRVSRDTGTHNSLELCAFENTGCEIYCDGFWVVIQDRNRETSQTFDRSLRDYRIGFGNIHSGYWMGLECLHYITTQRPYQLMIELTDEYGRVTSALYESFSVDNYFQLHLGRFIQGDAGDGLRASDGALFSTFDQDLDYSENNCAALHGGGWWYRDCEAYDADSFLNGNFAVNDYGNSGVRWSTKSTPAPIVSTRMLVKPSLFLPPGHEAFYQY